MSKQIELEKLDRTIKDGNIRLQTVNAQMHTLNKDIEALSELQDRLIDNIRFLKKKQIIAMAGEYKKAKEDLAKTVIRLISLQNDREHFRKAIAHVQQVMHEAEETIVKLKSINNVVHGDFGRKENGKG